MKAQTPSGGDSLAFGQAVDMSTRANSQHTGFLRGIGANITTVR